ncbi:aspartyl/asparaginyl beta-hydroxylase domain-containing protein [Streptacidiphilus albus]|uniref:aspartyl/asparaginyl beta-hydroxylase domain-containing protein n=1 Tax=Streptacidiphilus albus TaxID=105425 RepID=UPI000689668F|nr:aspartyl/asparaginyl beta-hydroxylase domain-containing protein [Streptacidiphilus albus]
MQPWLTECPAYLEQWIERQQVDRVSVQRVLDGMRISTRDEVGQYARRGQEPSIYIPGLSATPWWDGDAFPWLASLEAATADIIAEFESLGGLIGSRTLSSPSERADRGRWSAHYLYSAAKSFPRNIARCPQTVAALEPIPGALGCGMTYFSVMDPGTHVEAHTGFTNAHLRCHLGLVVPEGCRMQVGAESRGWQAGKAFVFDDSYVHEVWNESRSGRAVLLFDIWHPELTEIEVQALSYLMEVSRKLIYRNFWTKEFVAR